MILNFFIKNFNKLTRLIILHKAFFVVAPLYIFLKISEDNIKFKLN